MHNPMRWQRRYGRDWLRVIAVAYPLMEKAEAGRFGTRDAKALFISGETWPMTVVIDRDGNVRARIEGIFLSEEFGEKIKCCSGAACYARRVASWRSIAPSCLSHFLSCTFTYLANHPFASYRRRARMLLPRAVRIRTDPIRVGVVEIEYAMTLPTNKVRGLQENLGCLLTFVFVLAIAITLLAHWLSS
jgi:hypothetical protein